MANPKWFSAQLLFKDGELRDSAKMLLREVFLDNAGGSFGDECWLFPGGRQNPEGYKYVDLGGLKTRMAHRFVYEIFTGPIPPSCVVMHSCDNPPCCNPKHLSAGTGKENTRDMIQKGRYRNGQMDKTHCVHGHPFDEQNTKVYRGHRYCKACMVRNKHESYQRAKEAKLSGA